jgi:histidinol-phosphate aminotransferase
LGIPEAIKLASNEVPYGPLPGVVEAMTEAAAVSHRYPDMAVLELRARIAELYNLDQDSVLTGCGSVALAEHLVKATCLADDEVIYPWRSFEAYPIITASAGAIGVQVPNTAEHGHDLDAMRAAITPRTRLLFVCNPNNPTGTFLRKTELTDFLDQVPSDVLVVVDEAYREFVTDADVPDALEVFRDRPNIVVLRTLSKAWGLAGLRIGWLHASPEVAHAVHKCVTPFSTSTAAQAAALAALRSSDEMRRRVALVIAERDRVIKVLRELGVDVPDSQANFVWLPLGDKSAAFAKECEQRGVIVRPFQGHGVRITIGTPEENTAMLLAAQKAL